MPLTKKPTNPYGPDDRVRAWQSFATATTSVREGDVLRGDDEVVREHWPYFQPVDVPTAERKNVWSELPPPPDHRDHPGINIATTPIPAWRQVRALSDVYVPARWAPGSPGERAGMGPPPFGSMASRRGQVYDALTHAHVRERPDLYEWVARQVTAEDLARLDRLARLEEEVKR
jgi:hypothetical protein